MHYPEEFKSHRVGIFGGLLHPRTPAMTASKNAPKKRGRPFEPGWPEAWPCRGIAQQGDPCTRRDRRRMVVKEILEKLAKSAKGGEPSRPRNDHLSRVGPPRKSRTAALQLPMIVERLRCCRRFRGARRCGGQWRIRRTKVSGGGRPRDEAEGGKRWSLKAAWPPWNRREPDRYEHSQPCRQDRSCGTPRLGGAPTP